MSHFLYEIQTSTAGSSEEIQIRKKHREQYQLTSITEVIKERFFLATLKIYCYRGMEKGCL